MMAKACYNLRIIEMVDGRLDGDVFRKNGGEKGSEQWASGHDIWDKHQRTLAWEPGRIDEVAII